MNMIFNLLSVVASPTDAPVDTQSLPIPALCVAGFAVLFLVYVYIMKAINAKKAPETPDTAPIKAAPVSKPAPAGVTLENVEEKDAAVIMAIVANKSGIPIERLSFKSIKLTEDK